MRDISGGIPCASGRTAVEICPLDRPSRGSRSTADHPLTDQEWTQRHCSSAGAEGDGIERGWSPRFQTRDRENLEDPVPVGMAQAAGLPAGEENLSGVLQELHLNEGRQHFSGVASSTPPGPRLSQPPLDVGEGERGSLHVAASPASAIRDVTLEHGHGVPLDLGPVVPVRQEAHARHARPLWLRSSLTANSCGASRPWDRSRERRASRGIATG
jgi:hypothetical protein